MNNMHSMQFICLPPPPSIPHIQSCLHQHAPGTYAWQANKELPFLYNVVLHEISIGLHLFVTICFMSAGPSLLD